MNTTTSTTRTRRRLGLAATAALTALVAAPLAAAPASAAPADGEGWLRVGHFSPDTKAVDVTLTAVSGGQVVLDLDDVTFGQVSPYSELPAGTYTVAMTASDSEGRGDPVISADVTVAPDQPATVAAYGRTADLQTRVFQDDLREPAPGQAKLRLVQVATVAPTVDVATTTGTEIAEDARFGSATQYAEVAAGPWSLELRGEDVRGTADLDLTAGSVSTVFVVDDSTGGITAVPVTDSAATAATPVGGVQTGGGALAGDADEDATGPAAPAPGPWERLLALLGLR